MGSKNCLNHPNVPAATMCHGCHKPICNSCTMVTPMGKFCSSECSVLYRETKTKLKEGDSKGGGGFMKALLALILLALAGMAGIHFFGGESMKKYDVIQMLLNKDSDQPKSQPAPQPKK